MTKKNNCLFFLSNCYCNPDNRFKIFRDGDDFYFYDEFGIETFGPYKEFEITRKLMNYINWLNK